MVDLRFKPKLSLAYDLTTIFYSLPKNMRYADTFEATERMTCFDSDVFKSQDIGCFLLHPFLRLHYTLQWLKYNKLQNAAARHSFCSFVHHPLCARHVMCSHATSVNKAEKNPCLHKAYTVLVVGSGRERQEVNGGQ